MSFIEFGFPDKTNEFDSRAKGPRISQRDSHPGDYFIDGIRQPSLQDVEAFPYDDNTAGDELTMEEVLGLPALTPDVMDQDPNGAEAVPLFIGRFCTAHKAFDCDVCRRTEKESKLGGHPQFYEILEEMKNLYSAKHYQYATDADPMINFRLCGSLSAKLIKPGVNQTIAAALLLMSKQIVGVYEIVGEGKTNTIESLQDKLRDIGIYSVILQILVGETQQ